jgi:Kef-type K+ transport system membrane component KefB
MTYYVILVLCVLIILAYIFDISFKYSRIPGVIMLIALGIAIQMIVTSTGIRVPNMRTVLPILGTLGLILIVMDASLEIKLERSKAMRLAKGILSALVLFTVFVTALTLIMVNVFELPVKVALLNSIPLGIISSAVAISSAMLLDRDQREFITLESAISDIVGILAFDFILLNMGSIGKGLLSFALNGFITIIIAAVMTAILAFLLHKIKYHVSYILILTSVIMVYVLAELTHLPALLLVMVFGLALANNHLIEKTIVNQFVDFDKFREDISSFKKILAELTFLVRSFFFIMFGFYTSLSGLFNKSNLFLAAGITAGLFILRWGFLKFLMGRASGKLVYFAPRGLITILLFLSIPEDLRTDLINEEVVTLILLMSIFVMMIGNMLPQGRKPDKILKEEELLEINPAPADKI